MPGVQRVGRKARRLLLAVPAVAAGARAAAAGGALTGVVGPQPLDEGRDDRARAARALRRLRQLSLQRNCFFWFFFWFFVLWGQGAREGMARGGIAALAAWGVGGAARPLQGTARGDWRARTA